MIALNEFLMVSPSQSPGDGFFPWATLADSSSTARQDSAWTTTAVPTPCPCPRPHLRWQCRAPGPRPSSARTSGVSLLAVAMGHAVLLGDLEYHTQGTLQHTAMPGRHRCQCLHDQWQRVEGTKKACSTFQPDPTGLHVVIGLGAARKKLEVGPPRCPHNPPPTPSHTPKTRQPTPHHIIHTAVLKEKSAPAATPSQAPQPRIAISTEFAAQLSRFSAKDPSTWANNAVPSGTGSSEPTVPCWYPTRSRCMH